jgi:hypothetical protein
MLPLPIPPFLAIVVVVVVNRFDIKRMSVRMLFGITATYQRNRHQHMCEWHGSGEKMAHSANFQHCPHMDGVFKV